GTSVLMKQRSATLSHARAAIGFLILLGCSLSHSAFGQTLTPPTPSGNVSIAPAKPHAHDHTLPAGPSHPLYTLKQMAMREVTTIAVPNLQMTDQDGRRVKLYEDLMKDKLVVLSFFYTTCVGPCPTTGRWLSRLQEKLGERPSKDVIIVSISIDPKVDTPEKITQWAARWKRRPGWTLLTSNDAAAGKLTSEFLAGQLKGMHSPAVFVGDGRRNPIGWINVDVLDESRLLLHYFDQMKGR
ncbi:MAG TPA: SCO family protein, partial [Pyrinomonadaceae bacterium]|nr:SCO family protein [Pyrinomonadaceae bacterium]